MNKKALLLFLCLIAALVMSSCDPGFTGTVKDGTRNIIVDVDNSMFRLPTAANAWEQGPGITDLKLTFVMEEEGVTFDATLAAADAAAGDYTQLAVEVTGRLVRVDAEAAAADGAAVTVSIDDKPAYEEFHGWEIFANVQRFRIGYNGNSAEAWADGYLTLDIAPRGGTSVRFKVDSGVTAAPETDWGGTPLATRQFAFEPVLTENPAGLTFDVYTAVVDENLRDLYKPGYVTEGADYEYSPWKDVWTWDEVTTSGKQIGDQNVKLTKYNTGSPLPFSEPSGAGCGYDSFLVDLSAQEEDPVGKFLLISLVVKSGTLEVPTKVGVYEIR